MRIDVVEAGHRGDEATARSALEAPDAATRALALGALARMGRLEVADLEPAVADPAPAVRRRAAEEGGRLTTGDPRLLLAAQLDDAEPSVVEMAAWALGEHEPEPAAVAGLAGVATAHEDPLCREAAVAALGALGDPAGLQAILAGTRDRATVRRRAVLALAPFDGCEVKAALRAALEDRDWQVRQAAEDLLGPEGHREGTTEGAGEDRRPG